MASHRNHRLVFDRSAGDYDRARPGYPEAMIDDLVSRSGIPGGGRILEIGCGTGQMTVPLARRGYAITAVEVGRNLSQLAAANLESFPNAKIVSADFEQWDVEPHVFDLVVSAQAFHWIDPAIGYPKAHRALRSGGSLALVWSLFPGSAAPIYRALDEVYRLCVPQMSSASARRTLDERVERTVREIASSGLFTEPSVHRYPSTTSYTTSNYLRLLRTFSDHLTLDPADLERLLAAVRRTVDRFGGTIKRPQTTTLFLAKPARTGATA